MRTLQDWIRIKFTKYFWKDRKINFTTLLILGYLFLLAFTVVMKSPVNLWKNGDAGNDSSIFRYVGLEMAKGGMPYRDSFDHKGPLIFIINCFGIWISYYRGVWLIELISLFQHFVFYTKQPECCVIVRLPWRWCLLHQRRFLTILREEI